MREPLWILPETLIAAHEAQIAEHGGPEGIRDIALLESALAHPINLFQYSSPSLFELAASYGARIVGNHPFVDGNKRVAYIAMRLFLLLNGHDLKAPAPEKVRVVLALAAGELSEADLAIWLMNNSD